MKLRSRRAAAQKTDVAKKEVAAKKKSLVKKSARSSVKPTTTKTTAKQLTHEEFINAIPDKSRRDDVRQLHELVRRVAPNLEPTMEFASKNTLGYGKYHYKYKTGREGDWVKLGISNNKKNASITCCGLRDGKMVLEGFEGRLGKAHVGKSCVRFASLKNLNMDVVEELIRATANSDIMT